MTAPPPIPSIWDGEVFRPLPRFTRLADKHFTIGETYPLVVQEDRSMASHRHFFAAVHEAWANLPEPYATMLPTSEHARKYALCRSGWANQTQIVCASKVEAVRAFKALSALDDYAVIEARDAVVTVYTAKSQSVRAMGAADFKASKKAVLDFLAGLIGVSAEDLMKRGEAA